MPINFWTKPRWSQHHIHWSKCQNSHLFQWWQVFLLAGISVLQGDHAELPAPRKMSPYVLHSLHVEVSDVGELHPFTWLIKESTQYRLQKMKPDNKRCYMDKWERLQSSAGPVSCIQQKILPNKWHQTFTEESRIKQASVLWGSCMIWWVTLKLIMRYTEVTKQRSSWSWCPVTQNFAIKDSSSSGSELIIHFSCISPCLP